VPDKINAEVNRVEQAGCAQLEMLAVHYVPAGGSPAELESFSKRNAQGFARTALRR